VPRYCPTFAMPTACKIQKPPLTYLTNEKFKKNSSLSSAPVAWSSAGRSSVPSGWSPDVSCRLLVVGCRPQSSVVGRN